MLTATNSVTIDRPVDSGFAFVADGTTAPRWRPGVLDIAFVSGSGVGATYRQGVRGPMGRRIAADYRITALVPNSRSEFEAIAGPVRPHGRYDFASVDGGTRVTFSLEADLTGWRKFLMGSMVDRTMTAETQSLARLKQVLEAA
jgi:uncharacterized membrane protein